LLLFIKGMLKRAWGFFPFCLGAFGVWVLGSLAWDLAEFFALGF
jgi:hypothetical protein